MPDNILYAVATKINENSKYKCSKVSDKVYEQFEELNLDLDTKRLFQ